MVLSPFLRLLYFFFRLLAAAATTIYYRRHTVLGRRYAHFDGPAIVVSNHPSTLMDPLNVGVQVRQEMFFLANYGLFKHPVSAWLLSHLYCIPVKRREDVAEGEARNNDEAFEKSYQHMELGGVLYIAAEGVSWMHRWVRDFKTGAARISFGAERRNAWGLGVKIIPVGMDYSAAHLFRSEVTVHFGEPVMARDWQAAFEENPEAAVEALTAHLQQRVAALTVHARDEAGEAALQMWETIARNDTALPADAEQRRSQHFADVLLDDAALRASTEQYAQGLAASGLSDLGVKQL
ncbi:MAG TPA: 1-acyl-sn-glycerol-3-phosphate acyltransferase, partial [Saprospiraceae bacterium]|nr:1-acyl-sn-glycerol-3-phosphate acyltransferase [Saprospiraceae bacterium]